MAFCVFRRKTRFSGRIAAVVWGLTFQSASKRASGEKPKRQKKEKIKNDPPATPTPAPPDRQLRRRQRRRAISLRSRWQDLPVRAEIDGAVVSRTPRAEPPRLYGRLSMPSAACLSET